MGEPLKRGSAGLPPGVGALPWRSGVGYPACATSSFADAVPFIAPAEQPCRREFSHLEQALFESVRP